MATLFDNTSKWLNRTVDTASDQSQTSVESFINDPTPEKHTINAIKLIRTFIERLAGGKSLEDVLEKGRVCAGDVRADGDLKAWFDDFSTHVRKSLDQPGYARSDEASKTYKELRKRWKALRSQDTEEGKKWKEDVHSFKTEIRAFQEALDADADLKRVKRAHAMLGREAKESAREVGGVGVQWTVDQGLWIWRDLFNVYGPRVLGLLKDIPIPR